MPRLQIQHRTVYRYRKPVAFDEHRLMVRPRESYDQHVILAELAISPQARVRHLHDVFGNCVAIASFAGEAAELTFDSRVLLDHQPLSPPLDCEDAIRSADLSSPVSYDATDLPDLARSVERGFSDPDRTVDQWVRRFLNWNGSTRVLPLLVDIARAIPDNFTYRQRLEGPPQSPAETLSAGAGTCRDFAVLMMDAARALGLAAQFVSGYIYTAPTSATGDRRSVGGGHTHAWVAVYLPSCGWVEFDPTNGLVGNRDLVRVAVVRDPRQATPLWGSWRGQPDDYLGMEVEVDLTMEPERHLSVA